MYDTIDIDYICPLCQMKHERLQTKALEGGNSILKKGDKIKDYEKPTSHIENGWIQGTTICLRTDMLIMFKIIIKDGKIDSVRSYD